MPLIDFRHCRWASLESHPLTTTRMSQSWQYFVAGARPSLNGTYARTSDVHDRFDIHPDQNTWSRSHTPHRKTCCFAEYPSSACTRSVNESKF